MSSALIRVFHQLEKDSQGIVLRMNGLNTVVLLPSQGIVLRMNGLKQ